MMNKPTAFKVRERHQTGAYQEIMVAHTREEIRDTFGTDDSTLVSVMLSKLEAAEATITALETQLEAEKNHSDQLQRSLDRAYELKQALENES